MNCRDVRELGDSFLGDQLLTETNHEILRHLETCASCRMEIESRRRLRGALQAAFHRDPDLQPPAEFVDRLRANLRQAAAAPRTRVFPRGWFALAAGLLLTAGLAGAYLLLRPLAPADAIARDAVGDHLTCAVKPHPGKAPVPLEEAAQRFDSAYRLLKTAPPAEIALPDGLAQVIDRHVCLYAGRRFGHVVIQYRGRLVSLLMTASDGPAGGAASAGAGPQAIGSAVDGFSVVAMNGTGHAVLLVSDLSGGEMTELSRRLSLPLVQQLGQQFRERGMPMMLLMQLAAR